MFKIRKQPNISSLRYQFRVRWNKDDERMLEEMEKLYIELLCRGEVTSRGELLRYLIGMGLSEQ